MIILIDDSLSFTCERCRLTLSRSKEALSDLKPEGGDSGLVDELKKSALQTLRQEHADYHFAQDLARSDRPPPPPSPTRPSPSKKAKKMKKGDTQAAGIAKFFVQKSKS